MSKRTARTGDGLGLDLTKPIDMSTVQVTDGDCFGSEWDPSTDECKLCADSDVCCILKERVVKRLADKAAPNLTLDLARMHKVTDKEIDNVVHDAGGSLPLSEFIDAVMTLGITADRPSAVERIKRYKLTGHVSIKDNVVTWKK